MPVSENSIRKADRSIWPMISALVIAQVCKLLIFVLPQVPVTAVPASCYFALSVFVVVFALRRLNDSNARALFRCVSHELISAAATVAGIAFGGRLQTYFLPAAFLFGVLSVLACAQAATSVDEGLNVRQ